MTRRYTLAGLIAAAFMIPAGPLAAQGLGHGPFRVPEQNPIYGLFLTPRPESGRIAESGSLQVAWRSTYSNVFELSRNDRVESTFDYERWTNTLDLVWAPSARLEIGVRSSLLTGYGGVLDGVVQWWHDLLNLPNGDREDVENGLFESTLLVDGDTIVSLPQGTFVSDPIVWVGVPLFRGRQALTARVSLKLPIGSEEYSSGRPAVAVQVDGQHLFTKWATYAGVAVGTLGVEGPLAPFTPDLQATLHLGVERRLGDTWSVLAQLQGSSPFLEDVGHRELDRFPVNLGVGFAGRTTSGWEWQAALTEDVRANSPGVDFTLDLHLSRALR